MPMLSFLFLLSLSLSPSLSHPLFVDGLLLHFNFAMHVATVAVPIVVDPGRPNFD